MNTPQHTTPERDPIADKVIGLIEQEHVTPRPRWQFVLKEQLLWFFAVLALVLAAAASGVAVFAFVNSGFEFYRVTHSGVWSFLFDILPLFWIVIFGVALFIAYENIRHTGRGYRYSFFLLLASGVCIAAVGGTLVYITGLGSQVEKRIGSHIPLHRPTIEQQMQLWNQPEQGLLAGEIIDFSKDFSIVTIRSFDGSTWKVNGEDLRIRDCQALLASKEIRFVGLPIKNQQELNERVFHACFAIPWELKGLSVKEFTKSFSMRKIEPINPFPELSEELRERKFSSERSSDCKGVRPYQFLKTLRNEEALTL
ncbi:MAG: hypothetical protein KC582_02750 [Candidatus Magasanikbacteria bacterium]|nr:hypothetical protein [Candidatus Magasanikbacteria bacterium]MCA9389363.1 hypothetical protein [Candidatus Magasanikbacteria bacterium]MCA9391148.1 hypothetical protein [Candidatus Magasanikbacteria bacterium]USN52633.1 MAG: hypothetical protein H6759_00940 [Candidatus Nomurabacteria bacterium]